MGSSSWIDSTAVAAVCARNRGSSENDDILAFLAAATRSLCGQTVPIHAHSRQRGVADIVEGMVADAVRLAAGPGSGLAFEEASSKRSIEDFLLKGPGATAYIDVKSRDLDGKFSMPNLASIDRVDRLYRDPSSSLVYLFCGYENHGSSFTIVSVEPRRLETLSWNCLSIQNLGKGQIQIRNARKPLLTFEGDRQSWLRRMYTEASAFCGKLSLKASAASNAWQSRADAAC